MQCMVRVGHDCSKQPLFSRFHHLSKCEGILEEVSSSSQSPHQTLQPFSIADGHEAPHGWRGVQEGDKFGGRSSHFLELLKGEPCMGP